MGAGWCVEFRLVEFVSVPPFGGMVPVVALTNGELVAGAVDGDEAADRGRTRLDHDSPIPGEPVGPGRGNVQARMNHIIDTSEVLGTVETPGGASEVCASAEGEFGESKHICASLGIKAEEEKFRFGFAA